MKFKCLEIAKFLEEIAPKYLAEDWDNVGLIIGDFDKNIRHVLVCLDVTSAIVEYAEHNNVDLIVSHHPLIFEPMKNICRHNWKGNLIFRLIEKDICVYCAHTNLDYAKNGVNDHLAQILGLENIENLITKKTKDVFYGMGRTGTLSPSQGLIEFINHTKKLLKVKTIKLIGNIDREINKVAVFSGSFDNSLLNTLALNKDIDILVTGDIKYHSGIEITEMGICVIDAGHFATESIIIPKIEEYLKERFPGLVISLNTMETEPFRYY